MIPRSWQTLWRRAAVAGPVRVPERTWTGPVVSVVVLLGMLVVITVRQGYGDFPGPSLLVFTVLSWVPLLFRRRFAFLALLGVLFAEGLHLVFLPLLAPGVNAHLSVELAAFQPIPIATMVAVYELASRSTRSVGWTAGICSALGLLLVSVVAQPLIYLSAGLMTLILVMIATGVGVWVATRRDRIVRLARQQQEETTRQVVDERLRIARDLHDVLAHHLTLVNAQAGVAEFLLRSDPDRAATALAGINEHTRHALDELRVTVGLLRRSAGSDSTLDADTAEAAPGLARLEPLVDGFRRTGHLVGVQHRGDPRPLPATADVAAFRIVQEALTNAAKHAPGATTTVRLDWTGDHLLLHIGNGPATERLSAPAGTGNGLVGMRERAESCGGRLHSARTPAGGFAVDAVIPTALPTDDPTARTPR